jgi:serine/threonine protein kinase
MGAVYLGRQLSLDRPVAIKVLPPHLSDNEQFRTRFQLEARAVAKVSSPHVVQVYAAGTHQGHHYFAMEFVEGADLADRLRGGFRPSPKESIDLVVQAVKGLVAAGLQGVVHRDIKPGNMMISADGVLKLMDFGLAKLASEGQSLTMTGTVMGTVSYFSPEQGRGQATDQRTDIYAMGVVLYELLCRRLPFSGPDSTSVIYQHIHTEAVPPRQVDPGIGADIELVTMTCLRKSLEDRYQTAQELLEDLQSVLEGRPPAHARERNRHHPGTVNRRWPLLAAIGTMGVAAAAGFGYVLMQSDSTPTATPDVPIASPPPRTAPITGAAAPQTAVKPPETTTGPQDPVMTIRSAIGAGDWDKAASLLAAQRANRVQGPWDDLERDLKRGQAAGMVVSAQSAIERGELDKARPLLDRARELDPGAANLGSVQAAFELQRERRDSIAVAMAEIDAMIQRGELEGAERAAARAATKFGADAGLEAASKRIRDLVRARDEELVKARLEHASRLLARGEAAISGRDWEAAESALAEASTLQPDHLGIKSARKSAAEGRGKERLLAESVLAALTAHDLDQAQARQAELTAHAPRSSLIAAGEQGIQAELARRQEEKRRLERLEADMNQDALNLLRRIEDASQPLAQVTDAVDAWTRNRGQDRKESIALLEALRNRTLQERTTAVLADLDRAVMSGDPSALASVVTDRRFATGLAELKKFSGLVFQSRLISATSADPAAPVQASVLIRHALDVFPAKDLAYDFRLERNQDGMRIVNATLKP